MPNRKMSTFVSLWVNGVQDAPVFGDDVDRLVGNAATRQGLGRGTG